MALVVALHFEFLLDHPVDFLPLLASTITNHESAFKSLETFHMDLVNIVWLLTDYHPPVTIVVVV